MEIWQCADYLQGKTAAAIEALNITGEEFTNFMKDKSTEILEFFYSLRKEFNPREDEGQSAEVNEETGKENCSHNVFMLKEIMKLEY